MQEETEQAAEADYHHAQEFERQRWEHEQAIQAKLFSALSKAQGQMGAAAKNNKGNYGKFADLSSIREASAAPLADNGLAIYHRMSQPNPKRLACTCVICHEAGGTIESTLECALQDESPQKIGSAETYLRRYTMLAALGIATDDDDGQAAQPVQRAPQRQPARPAAEKPKPAKPTGLNEVLYSRAKELYEENEAGKLAAQALNKKHGVKWADFANMNAGDVAAYLSDLDNLAETGGAK